MKVILIRHGRTDGNVLGKYMGRTDEPLSKMGEMEGASMGSFLEIEKVVSSPMARATDTARLLFPNAYLDICTDFCEMDFGDFEGRSAEDMRDDAEYMKWVDSMCTSSPPNGENLEAFKERTCRAFDLKVRQSIFFKEKCLVIVAHGGTIMAVMERYALPARPYFEWHVKNCCGYSVTLDENKWMKEPFFEDWRDTEGPCR